MTAFWIALGLSGLFALGAAFPLLRSPRWVRDSNELEGKRLRDYRLFLERRRGLFAIGTYIVPSLAVLWAFYSAVALIHGSVIGLAYLAPAALFALAHWLGNRSRAKLLGQLGDRGKIPLSSAEAKARPWYRVWGAMFAVGFVGPSAMEYIYDRSFDDVSSPLGIVHFLLSLMIIVGAIGMAVTYFNTRERESAGQ